jgi:predicted molibdopterin-dependent oxidoreductase YjgC
VPATWGDSFAYTDYRPVTDPANRAEYARAWGVPEESLSLERGMMVTEIVQDGSPIRGMYIMGENPVISDPNIAHAEEWVRGLEFLAVQDIFLTETARWADVVLPGSSFAEKSGTYVNTDRHIQLADAALEPPGRPAATSPSSSTSATGSASPPPGRGRAT